MSTPWMKFYPTDWRGDQTLRAVSLAARGLWIEMLMIMHEATPYGHLVLGAQPVRNDVLSRMVGALPVEIEPLLAELETAGVYSRTGRGVIYSRRMTKDRQKANKCRKAVKTRWAQPTDTAQEKLRPNRSPTTFPSSDLPPRSQTPEQEGSSSSPSVNTGEETNSSNEKYAIQHGRFRLTHDDLERWKRSFPHVAVEGQCIASALWASKEPRPFYAMSGRLAKLEREATKTNGVAEKPAEYDAYWQKI